MELIPRKPRQQNQRTTSSVCPVCLRRIPAVLLKSGDEWHMRKECGEHGLFTSVVWRGAPERQDWIGHSPEIREEENPDCPTACGLCGGHKQDTCCVLLEITSRCNLACRFCFAEAEKTGPQNLQDPPLQTVKAWIDDIAGRGKAFLQLSGGEPSIRDDLPEIVRHAKEAGCEYVQLNSNGLRLAEEEDFAAALAEAGLSFVFMQFDGMDDAIYATLRGRPLLDIKKKAIEVCGRHNIGVTLVPTLVPGVNDKDIGNIVRFAVASSPLVRGVHFQPVSYFGRYPKSAADLVPDEKRMTLPEVYRAVFEQAGDIVPADSIVPSRCDHAACGFHGGYIVTPQGLKALTPQEQPACCPSSSAAERNRHFVGKRWLRPQASCCDAPAGQDEELCDLNSLDGFLRRARTHSFTLSSMAFQDAANLDLERLQQCSLHVYDKGRIVPFCSRYIFG